MSLKSIAWTWLYRLRRAMVRPGRHLLEMVPILPR